MISAGLARGRAADGWRVRYGFNLMVDFCIWVLEMDGLRLAPFDDHREGPCLLRAMGVEAKTWRAWLHAIVAQQSEPEGLDAALTRQSHYPALRSTAVPPTPRRFHPPALWPGHPNVRPWLEELWEQYGPIALERRGSIEHQECALVQHWLEEALSDLDPRPEQLHIYLVRYPSILAYPVPPDALILGIDSCQADHSALWTAVREAIPALARP